MPVPGDPPIGADWLRVYDDRKSNNKSAAAMSLFRPLSRVGAAPQRAARRSCLSALATLAALSLLLPLTTSLSLAQGRDARLFMAVSEGTSGSINASEAVEKYRPLADALSKAAGIPVIVNLVRNFEALEKGMKDGEFDLVLARPSDYPARGIRDYGYSLVVTSKPDGQCLFIVEKDSKLRTLADARGKFMMFPEKVAYMTKFCSAEMRDRGFVLEKENVKYAKEQGAVGWAVEKKMADLGGVASYSGVGKGWEKGGHRILHKSGPQPYFPLIAHKRVAPERIGRMQKALSTLGDSEAGSKLLKNLGIQGYQIEDSQRLLALLAWLEKK